MQEIEGGEYNYLGLSGFTNEIFKIQIDGLPKFYGMAEIKKLFNNKMKIEASKIKVIRNGWPLAYVCFKNEEARANALLKINGYIWKNCTLSAANSAPKADPLAKKRQSDHSSGGGQLHKKPMNSSQPLSDLPYEKQLLIKQGKMKEVLLKLGSQMWTPDRKSRNEMPCELHEIIASPQIDGYRNKSEFTVGFSETGDIVVGNRLGAYSAGVVAVGSVENLKLINDKMKLAAKLFQQFVVESGRLPFSPETYEGFYRQFTVRSPFKCDEIMLICTVNPQNVSPEDLQKNQEEFVAFFENGAGKDLNATSLYYEEQMKGETGQKLNNMKHVFGEKYVHDFIHGIKFRISPASFFQGNTSATEKLYQCAIDMACPTTSTIVLDICCGTGSIGLCFAKHCKKVLGVEIIPEAIEDADFNAKENCIENCTFVSGNANDLIYSLVKTAQITEGGKLEDVIAIVDPPRAGLHSKSIMQLRNSEQIQRIIYISCSPEQAIKNWLDLTRQCSKTLKGAPFKLIKAVPVDMFPHTPHTELVLLFERLQDDSD